MRMAHTPGAVELLRAPSAAAPWRVLVSGCIFGWGCGVDGTDYGMGGSKPAWFASPWVTVLPFCPEKEGLGVPRTMPDLHGGDGFAVLDGRARVRDERGGDLTDGMLAGAAAMVAFARAERVDLAVLTDMSAACGSQVISDGCRFDAPRRFQRGVGVAAAALLRAGVPVVSQRDHATLAALGRRLGLDVADDRPDHHLHPWVLEHLPVDR
jgi:uncharacterized protein YbbK (DUF523 family)